MWLRCEVFARHAQGPAKQSNTAYTQTHTYQKKKKRFSLVLSQYFITLLRNHAGHGGACL